MARLMPGLATILLFCGVSFVLVATPGPGVLYVVGRSIDQGRRAGVASMLGIELAEVVHVFAVALGLSALLATSAHALEALRYAGAVYLVVLGVRRWRQGAGDLAAAGDPASPRRILAQGFVVQSSPTSPSSSTTARP
jgi:threonine/homoserine/homoserine lactone efflux protein